MVYLNICISFVRSCQDEASGLYVCKLCMFTAYNMSDLEVHLSSTGGHTEASFLFRKYYSVWQSELDSLRSFAEESFAEEERKGLDHDRIRRRQKQDCRKRGQSTPRNEHSLSVYKEQDYQLNVFTDLTVGIPSLNSSSALVRISKDLYDAPVLTNPDQLSLHMQRQRESKNPYSLTAMKRSLDELSERVSSGKAASSAHVRTVATYSCAAIEDLHEYLDDDEISLLDSMNLLTAFKKRDDHNV